MGIVLIAVDDGVHPGGADDLHGGLRIPQQDRRDNRVGVALAPKTFRTVAASRAWLTTHHRARTELIVACHKVAHAARGVTYTQALDEALCYGWIDGVRRSVDAISFSVRFTPRKPRSTWSRVNITYSSVKLPALSTS